MFIPATNWFIGEELSPAGLFDFLTMSKSQLFAGGVWGPEVGNFLLSLISCNFPEIGL